MKTFHILFTGVGRRIELLQAFREAAFSIGKELKIYGVDSSLTAPALAFCDYRRKICRMKDPGYIDELFSICRKDRIDLLIPTIDTDLLVLSENRERFKAAGIEVLVSSPEMVRICRDKNFTSQFFIDCGLKAPQTVNDWREYQGNYPAFIKPKDGSSSIDAYKVENKEELKRYAAQIEDYIVQPFIEGTEYTVDIFADFKGNPLYITPRIRLAVRAGEVLKTQIDMDKEILVECRKITSVFKPCGPMTVQLIRNKKGENYYIEINPRFGGGAPLSMKAGAKSAEAILQLLDGKMEDLSQNILNGAVYSRFDQNVRIKVEGNNAPSLLKGVIFDLDDTLYSEKEYVRSGFKAVAEFLEDGTLATQMWRAFEDGKAAIDTILEEKQKMELRDECLKIYRSHKPDICLYDGVADLIKAFKSVGIRVGIVTDGRPEGQRNKIEVLGLNHMVDDIIVTDELGGVQLRKPCDIAFRILARRWKLPYEYLVYIGDNIDKDFQGPQQLGMWCVWFNNKEGVYQEREGDEDQLTTVYSIEELEKMLWTWSKERAGELE